MRPSLLKAAHLELIKYQPRAYQQLCFLKQEARPFVLARNRGISSFTVDVALNILPYRVAVFYRGEGDEHAL